MSEKRRRVHVTLPNEVVEAIDQLIGSGRRRQFIVDAVEPEPHRRMTAALEKMVGSLADVDISGWETRESAAAWVRALRRGEPLPGFSIAIDDYTS